MKLLLAVLLAANVLAPSGVLQTPAAFNLKHVQVLGLVENIAVRAIPGGFISQFTLCDSRCINVVEFSKPTVVIGQSVTVAGIFHTIFSNGPIQARNVVVVTAPIP